MTFTGYLWYLGAFALALGILIVVHEFGHYGAARLCGVKVLRFSVGFGKPLLCRKWGRDETEWVLAAFPLGGYVKMLDEREAPVAEVDRSRSFNRQTVARRSLIVAAGPLANLALAVLLYWIVYLQGTEELRPVLGPPVLQSLAANAGVEAEETVTAVSGRPVATWQELRWQLLQRAADGETAVLEVVNPKGEMAFRSLYLGGLGEKTFEGDLAKEIGLTVFRPTLKPIVGSVAAGSPAAAAGIRTGDLVLAVDGHPIATWAELAQAIRQSPGRAMSFAIERDGAGYSVAATPRLVEDAGRKIGRLGIGAYDDREAHAKLFVLVRLGPLEAAQRAVGQTWDTSVFTLRMIGRMVVGELSWKNVSGPVTIADYAGQSARMGAAHYLKFLALISISLGVLNLLPIPILDGGHLLYHLIEFVKGGPLSERSMEIGQQIGLAILALLMAFAFYNDINRLVSG